MDKERGFELLKYVLKAMLGLVSFVMAMVGIRKNLENDKVTIRNSDLSRDDDIVD